jgi:uncharacterized protein (TIGR03435 family)
MHSLFKSVICACCALLFASACFAQAQQKAASFELSEIHKSAPARNEFMRGPYLHHGPFDVYEIRDANFVELISTAFDIDATAVVGGPSWLEQERFDINAKADPKTSREALRTMLRSLLVDRFGLVYHNEKRPLSAWGLTASKHPLLKKPADSEAAQGCQFSQNGGGPNGGPPSFTFACHNGTMANLADQLVNGMPTFQYLNNRPVVDQTGLEGGWDFTLHFTTRLGSGGTGGEVITIFDALDKQLGLKLEPTTAPLPVVVVDALNRAPDENSPAAKQALSFATAKEFDVAEIKPTDPSDAGVKFNIQPSGQVNISGVSLQLLIQQIYQINQQMIVDAPKWLNDDRWTIVAKPPADAAVFGPGSTKPVVDFDVDIAMLKALLAERFKMKAHIENREMNAYTLVAVKPKMKQADPTARTRYFEGAAALDVKDPRNTNPSRSRLVTFENFSMPDFSEQLQRFAPGYIYTSVLDKTGLKGGWDFTLSFSTIGQSQQPGAPAAAGAGGEGASDPTGAVTLFDAIERQLGLKLVAEKRAVPVLVIDHIEQKPSEN